MNHGRSDEESITKIKDLQTENSQLASRMKLILTDYIKQSNELKKSQVENDELKAQNTKVSEKAEKDLNDLKYLKDNFCKIRDTQLSVCTRASINNFFLPRVKNQAIHGTSRETDETLNNCNFFFLCIL